MLPDDGAKTLERVMPDMLFPAIRSLGIEVDYMSHQEPGEVDYYVYAKDLEPILKQILERLANLQKEDEFTLHRGKL